MKHMVFLCWALSSSFWIKYFSDPGREHGVLISIYLSKLSFWSVFWLIQQKCMNQDDLLLIWVSFNAGYKGGYNTTNATSVWAHSLHFIYNSQNYFCFMRKLSHLTFQEGGIPQPITYVHSCWVQSQGQSWLRDLIPLKGSWEQSEFCKSFSLWVVTFKVSSENQPPATFLPDSIQAIFMWLKSLWVYWPM